jgi:Domain of unknown function (DUF4747)
MAKQRSILVSVLNITIHPHSPKQYVELFDATFASGRAVPYRGNQYGMLGSSYYLDENNPLVGISGEIYRYLDFDPGARWLNIEEHKVADQRDMRSVRIPDHLRPEFVSARYVFFPKVHRIFFESRTADGKAFGPTSVYKLMHGLMNQPQLTRKFGKVDVVIEPSKEGLRRILEMPKLDRLEILIRRPNPEDLAGAEKRVLRRLERQSAEHVEENLKAVRGKSIQPDRDTQTLARIGASNGQVMGIGKDQEGRPLRVSTTDHPWFEAERFDPDLELASEAFMRRAQSMLQRLLNRLGG